MSPVCICVSLSCRLPGTQFITCLSWHTPAIHELLISAVYLARLFTHSSSSYTGRKPGLRPLSESLWDFCLFCMLSPSPFLQCPIGSLVISRPYSTSPHTQPPSGVSPYTVPSSFPLADLRTSFPPSPPSILEINPFSLNPNSLCQCLCLHGSPLTGHTKWHILYLNNNVSFPEQLFELVWITHRP